MPELFVHTTHTVCTVACAAKTVLPLLPHAAGSAHQLLSCPDMPCADRSAQVTACAAPLSVGTLLSDSLDPDNGPLFRVIGQSLLPGQSRPCPWLEALRPIVSGRHSLTSSRHGWAVACITLSDKGWRGEREDRSGPKLLEIIHTALPVSYSRLFLLPDSPSALQALTLELAYGHGYDLILTTGGTGLSPRDLTPEALLPLLTRRLHGLEHVMMAASLAKTPHAALSRALAGSLGSTLVITLPGSVRGACENLEATLSALPHALEKLAGDPSDCGG